MASLDIEVREDGPDARVLRIASLRERVRGALRMARLMLEEVLDTRFANEAPAEYLNLVGKASGELAMLLRMAKRALPSPQDAALIDELARDLAPHARTPHAYRSLLLRPSRAPMYALAHLCLVQLGVADEKFDRVARLALRSSVCAANERVPYRMLDAAWARHLAFGVSELEHPAIPLSPLGAGVDLLEATTDDAYAFTHALPYATDFGRVPLPANLDRRMLLSVAEALAVKALDENDLDLLSEVLMAPGILGLGWTPTLSFAWGVLERVWNHFGFVPGPGVPLEAVNETRPQAVRRVLGTVYHTTFAAGLCCATLIACGAPPPEAEKGPGGGMLAPPGRGLEWKVDWERSSRRTQESLLFMGLAFRLKREVEAVDLVAIREIVNCAAEAEMLGHPLFTQALELLERVSASLQAQTPCSKPAS